MSPFRTLLALEGMSSRFRAGAKKDSTGMFARAVSETPWVVVCEASAPALMRRARLRFRVRTWTRIFSVALQ
jgi:hypothetical protein